MATFSDSEINCVSWTVIVVSNNMDQLSEKLLNHELRRNKTEDRSLRGRCFNIFTGNLVIFRAIGPLKSIRMLWLIQRTEFLKARVAQFVDDFLLITIC